MIFLFEAHTPLQVGPLIEFFKFSSFMAHQTRNQMSTCTFLRSLSTSGEVIVRGNVLMPSTRIQDEI